MVSMIQVYIIPPKWSCTPAFVRNIATRVSNLLCNFHARSLVVTLSSFRLFWNTSTRISVLLCHFHAMDFVMTLSSIGERLLKKMGRLQASDFEIVASGSNSRCHFPDYSHQNSQRHYSYDLLDTPYVRRNIRKSL